MKKGWIIALCVLLVLGAGAGYGYYRVYGAAAEAEQTQKGLYEQYQAMLERGCKIALPPQKQANFPVYAFFTRDPDDYKVEFQFIQLPDQQLMGGRSAD